MSESSDDSCTLAGMARVLERLNQLERPNPSTKEIQDAYVSAERLAGRAFRDRDKTAEALAERLLHLIHVNSAFSAPHEPVASVVWSVLLRGKLGATLGAAPDIEPATLGDHLRAVVVELGAYNHPIVDLLPKDSDILRRWLKNWYASTHGYTYQMTSIAKRCAPESEISAYVPVMFKNLSDELADEFSKTPHHLLRHRILERAGTFYDLKVATTDSELVTEAFSLQSYRTGVTCLPNPMYALGSVYGIEANWVLETPKLSARLREIGFNSHDLESTDLHAQLDTGHAQEWLEMVMKIPMTPQQAGQVLVGARVGLQVRRAMYDAVLAAKS